MNYFVGKYVKVYPGDTWSKFATVEEVLNEGVVFKIDGVRSEAEDWKGNDGKKIFIAYSASLTFIEVDKN
jgi:hypothetical protein